MSLTFALLAACYSPEDFSADYNAVQCDKIYECNDEAVLEYIPNRGEDLESCYAERDEDSPSDVEDCAFDAKVGQECVEEMSRLTCSDYNGGTNWPASCDLVCGEDADEGE